MTGPYAENAIVMDIETGSPERCLQFNPDGLPTNRWLHRLGEFDKSLDSAAVIDRYALPKSDEYEVGVVEVPAGEKLRLGSVAAIHGRSGGGDLVEVLDRDAIPEDWIVKRTSLNIFLE